MDHTRIFLPDIGQTSRSAFVQSPGDVRSFDFKAFLRSFKRDIVPFLTWLACCWLIAGLVVYRTPVEYTASTQIMLESIAKKRHPLDNEATIAALDSALADSRIQVIKSERLLRFVFDTLDLKNSPDYAIGAPGFIHRLTHPFSRDHQLTPDERITAAFLAFTNRLGVRRVGLSYVVEISFRASTPRAAAQMANSISSAYIRELVLSNQRDEEILQRRITDVKAEEQVLRDAILSGRVPDHDFADASGRIISAAIEPLTKSAPQTGLIFLFATAFGIFTGSGVIFFRYGSDRKIRTRRQAQGYFGFSRVAAIADAKPANHAKTKTARWPSCVIACMRSGLQPLISTMVKPEAHETNMAIGLLSWAKGAGTSSVAYSFATLLADCNHRVVLVDANSNNSDLSETLTPNEFDGLSDALALKDPSNCLGRLRSINSLRFLPWGKGRVGEASLLLGTWRMKLILKQLKDVGTVLIDLPPLNCSPEAQNISPLLDGIILVIDATSTTIDDVTEALLLLQDNQMRVLAVALNKAEDIRSISDRGNHRGNATFWKFGFAKRRNPVILGAKRDGFVPGEARNVGRSMS